MPIDAGHLALPKKGLLLMHENQEPQSMSPDEGVIEILCSRIAELERDNARARITILLKEQELTQLRGDQSQSDSA